MKPSPVAFCHRHVSAILVATVVLLTLLAWSNRFIQDDAFISFRYADHWAHGNGLVYNPGDRLEGYTNFLWTVLIGAGIAVSLDPVPFSYGLGLTFFVLSLYFTYRLADLACGSKPAGLLAVLLLGTNYTFSAYATGGLETQLQACLCTAIAWLVLRTLDSRVAGRGSLLAIGLLTSAALLTRLDSSVFLFVLFPAAMFGALRAAQQHLPSPAIARGAAQQQLPSPACGKTAENKQLPSPACGKTAENKQLPSPACGKTVENKQLPSPACGKTVENKQLPSPACGRGVGGEGVWQRSRWLSSIGPVAWLCVVPMLIVGGWLLWKLAYYGDILPNTYYAKVGSPAAALRGLAYCADFVREYWLMPLVFLGLTAASRWVAAPQRKLLVLVLTIAVWCLYVVRVGGDFMEFRFLVPIMPLIFVSIAWLLVHFIRPAAASAALAAMLLIGSLHHAITYDNQGVESIRQLQRHISSPEENWQTVGRVLGRLFDGGRSNVVMAVTAAGAIPYYSRLETIDMGGLNDRWVARHGRIVGSRPGHQRIATLDYLLDRGVNLVVGVPLVMPRHPGVKSLAWVQSAEQEFRREASAAKLPAGSRMIEIPLDRDYKITVLYLVQNDLVDEVIRQQRLKTYPVATPQAAGQ